MYLLADVELGRYPFRDSLRRVGSQNHREPSSDYFLSSQYLGTVKISDAALQIDRSLMPPWTERKAGKESAPERLVA